MATTMTYAGRTEAVAPVSGSGLFERVRRYVAQRRLQATIFAELDALSDRDLADIGLSRHALKDVARTAALAA